MYVCRFLMCLLHIHHIQKGVSALMHAIEVCDEEVVGVLVEKGANVNTQSEVSPQIIIVH